MGRSVPTACLFLLACPVVTSIWVQTARPCKVHPGGGAVVTIYGTGFRPTFSSPEPVVYIGPDTRNTYIHPQYTRRLSNETIEIAAPITGWGLSGISSRLNRGCILRHTNDLRQLRVRVACCCRCNVSESSRRRWSRRVRGIHRT